MAEFIAAKGMYEGRWFDPKFKRVEGDPEQRDSRLWSLPAAETIVAACRGKTGTVTEEAKPSTQMSPLLLDLTSLQREANGRFGFSAKNTLGLAQALYEKHKVLTYPRTDARALPEDYIPTVKDTLAMLKESNNYLPHAKQVLDKGWVKPNKRIFDNSKICDHFAIIPTLQAPKALSEPEQKLYDLVVKRFLAVFFPAAEYLVTTRITEVAGHRFKTKARYLSNRAGCRSTARKWAAKTPISCRFRRTRRSMSRRSRRSACDETAGTLQRSVVALGHGRRGQADRRRGIARGDGREGLGTPATRAAVIEGLLGEKYMVREGRELIPTAKAFQLMTLLRGLGVEELTAPELTGEWEHKLSQMERGKLPRDEFMQEIARMTQTHREACEGIRLRHHSRRLFDARNAVPELRQPD